MLNPRIKFHPGQLCICHKGTALIYSLECGLHPYWSTEVHVSGTVKWVSAFNSVSNYTLPDSFGRQRSSSYKSHQWELKLYIQPSCSNHLECPASCITLCWDIWAIQICDEETFLRSGIYKLIMWLLPWFVFFLTTYGALPNAYNNNTFNTDWWWQP